MSNRAAKKATKREQRAQRRQVAITFAAGVALHVADNRRQATERDDLRKFCARACGVNYVPVGEVKREGVLYDYDVKVQDLHPPVANDGTPGSVYRFDAGSIDSARRDMRQMVDSPRALVTGTNGMLTHDSVESVVIATLAEVLGC